MAKRLDLAADCSMIAGAPRDSLEIEVRYFADPTIDIETLLREAPPHTYANSADENVVARLSAAQRTSQ